MRLFEARAVFPQLGTCVGPHASLVRQQFFICFRARPVGGELRTSSESKEVRWVAPADLDTLNIHASMRLRIDHALDESRTAPYIG